MLGKLSTVVCVAFLCAGAGATAAQGRPSGRDQVPSYQRLLVLGGHGRTHTRIDPYLPRRLEPQAPAGAGAAPAPRARHRRHRADEARAAKAKSPSKHGPTVEGALRKLDQAGTITSRDYGEYDSDYRAAKRSLKKLTGTRKEELEAVVANVEAIAADGGFIPSRLPALFLTLASNRKWWTTGPLLSSDERVSFPGSRLVWEHYPGQGIEIQWLGTFGEANGYYLSGNENGQLRQLLQEAIPLATDRAGGIAWEYMFRFDGGLPPWTSGLSQGTALQALSRAWSRFKEPTYLQAAEQSLGIFQQAPPQGVRVSKPNGAWYAEYTYAPSDWILNGFIQAVVGLYDFTSLTQSTLGLQLFDAGDAVARTEVPHFNTGAWSMYDQHTESNLNYHELLAEFLKNLCRRTEQGSPLLGAVPPPVTETPPTGEEVPPTTTATGGTQPPAIETPAATQTPATTGAAGGTAAPPGTAAAIAGTARTYAAKTGKTQKTPIVEDAVYCQTATSFGEYLHSPPTIKLLSHKLRANFRAGVQVSLSKVATVGLTVRRGGKVVWTNSALVEGGKPRILWVTPKTKGSYSVTVSATDLAGNDASATGRIRLTG